MNHRPIDLPGAPYERTRSRPDLSTEIIHLRPARVHDHPISQALRRHARRTGATAEPPEVRAYQARRKAAELMTCADGIVRIYRPPQAIRPIASPGFSQTCDRRNSRFLGLLMAFSPTEGSAGQPSRSFEPGLRPPHATEDRRERRFDRRIRCGPVRSLQARPRQPHPIRCMDPWKAWDRNTHNESVAST